MSEKKQIPLRLKKELYLACCAWADDYLRSVNCHLAYLFTLCVKQRKKNGHYVPETLDEPPKINIE